jgi:hypothetical protein
VFLHVTPAVQVLLSRIVESHEYREMNAAVDDTTDIGRIRASHEIGCPDHERDHTVIDTSFQVDTGIRIEITIDGNGFHQKLG